MAIAPLHAMLGWGLPTWMPQGGLDFTFSTDKCHPVIFRSALPFVDVSLRSNIYKVTPGPSGVDLVRRVLFLNSCSAIY